MGLFLTKNYLFCFILFIKKCIEISNKNSNHLNILDDQIKLYTESILNLLGTLFIALNGLSTLTVRIEVRLKFSVAIKYSKVLLI